MNWKDRGNGCYDALASRLVGGKYFIRWIETYYSDEYCERFDVRSYHVDYQTKGGGGIGNISTYRIRRLEDAKALAELDHKLQKEIVLKYGELGRNIPSEAWSQLRREEEEWQKRLPGHEWHAQFTDALTDLQHDVRQRMRRA
jgi:hypothetical protein